VPRAMHGFIGIKDTLFVFGGMYYGRFLSEGAGVHILIFFFLEFNTEPKFNDSIIIVAVLLNDMYLLDLQKLEWKKINVDDVLGTFPSARRSMGMVVINEKIVIYGGFGAEGMFLVPRHPIKRLPLYFYPPLFC
jgi:hypothetical protein